mgnify:CR=1 FL=1
MLYSFIFVYINKDFVKLIFSHLLKTHNVDDFGLLLLSDKFMMRSNDQDQEFHIFLFEHSLLCCKDTKKTIGKAKLEKILPAASITQPVKNVEAASPKYNRKNYLIVTFDEF